VYQDPGALQSGALLAIAEFGTDGHWRFVGRIDNTPSLLAGWYRLKLEAQETVLEHFAAGRVPAVPIFDGSTAVATTFSPSLVMANLEKFSRATSLTRPSPPTTPARRSAPLSDQPPSRREPSADDDLASLDNLTLVDPFTAVDGGGRQTMVEDRGNYRLFSPPNVGTGRVA
jgi:hypothetical protein